MVRNFGKLKSGKTVFNFSLISSKNMFTTEACSQRFLLQQQYQQFQKIEDSELNAKTNINFITKEDNQVILNSLESNITAIELKGRNSKHPKTVNSSFLIIG